MPKEKTYYTAVKFAEKLNISYPTVIRWLKQGIVPDATWEQTPMGKVWQIPESALKMERPRPGPKKKEEAVLAQPAVSAAPSGKVKGRGKQK
jgi:predicted site-specific integrase-resolvase